MEYITKYRIERGSTRGDRTSIYDATPYDDIIQRIVGIYDSLEEARKQIPNDWIAEPNSSADLGCEDYYEPGTDEKDMDGYRVLVRIIPVGVPVDELHATADGTAESTSVVMVCPRCKHAWIPRVHRPKKCHVCQYKFEYQDENEKEDN